jgi:hypothetical protein
MLLNGVLIGEELQERKEAEMEKLRRKSSNKKVQQYGTIKVGDARLKIMARDEARDRRIELYNLRQEEKEQERREIDDRKERRLQKRQEMKQAKCDSPSRNVTRHGIWDGTDRTRTTWNRGRRYATLRFRLYYLSTH